MPTRGIVAEPGSCGGQSETVIVRQDEATDAICGIRLQLVEIEVAG